MEVPHCMETTFPYITSQAVCNLDLKYSIGKNYLTKGPLTTAMVGYTVKPRDGTCLEDHPRSMRELVG